MTATMPRTFNGPSPRVPTIAAREKEEDAVETPMWNRITWVDLVLVLVMTYGTIRFWSYVIMHF